MFGCFVVSAGCLRGRECAWVCLFIICACAIVRMFVCVLACVCCCAVGFVCVLDWLVVYVLVVLFVARLVVLVVRLCDLVAACVVVQLVCLPCCLCSCACLFVSWLLVMRCSLWLIVCVCGRVWCCVIVCLFGCVGSMLD